MSSLEVSDATAECVAVAPRVSLDDIRHAIKHQYTFTAGCAVAAMNAPAAAPLDILTICILVLDNGFVVIGKSAPASPANFDMRVGAEFAYEDAVRQLWPLMGYALRDRLHTTETVK